MTFALLSMNGVLFVLRWIHFFFGVIWIGLLYYFNFVQGPFMAEADAATKSQVLQKLLPRALFWFRWAAMATMLSGIIILTARGHTEGAMMYSTSWGIAILTGTAFGLTMWANVWFVIWPNQKVVIANAIQVAQGGQANPLAAACGAKALLASRSNVLFSIPMLFFMGAASHLPLNVNPGANLMVVAAAVGAILLVLELNAIKGKLGPLASVVGVIHCGLALALVVYGMLEFLVQ